MMLMMIKAIKLGSVNILADSLEAITDTGAEILDSFLSIIALSELLAPSIFSMFILIYNCYI